MVCQWEKAIYFATSGEIMQYKSTQWQIIMAMNCSFNLISFISRFDVSIDEKC